jgi:hypothetical protein
VHHRRQHGKTGVLTARTASGPLNHDVSDVIDIALRVGVRGLALPKPHSSILVQNVAIQLTARAIAAVGEPRDGSVKKHLNLIDGD